MEMISRVGQTEIHPVNLFHNPAISLNSYTLTKIKMCRTMLLDKEAIVTEVTMGRPIMNTFLTVFIPTTLLLVISFTARAFVQEYIDVVNVKPVEGGQGVVEEVKNGNKFVNSITSLLPTQSDPQNSQDPPNQSVSHNTPNPLYPQDQQDP